MRNGSDEASLYLRRYWVDISTGAKVTNSDCSDWTMDLLSVPKHFAVALGAVLDSGPAWPFAL